MQCASGDARVSLTGEVRRVPALRLQVDQLRRRQPCQRPFDRLEPILMHHARLDPGRRSTGAGERNSHRFQPVAAQRDARGRPADVDAFGRVKDVVVFDENVLGAKRLL